MISLLLTAALALATPARADDTTSAWQLHLQQVVDQAGPQLAAQAADAPVVPTRDGGLRVVDLGAEWGPVLLADRLLDGGDSLEVRLALAAGIAPRIHQWPDIAAGLVDLESDPAVLAMLLGGLQRVPADLALPRLEAALGHADPAVRIEAAVVLGRHLDGAAAAGALVGTLSDGDALVRARAARALGRHQVGTAFEALATTLTDRDATVRLSALRALERIDAGRAAALPVVRTLLEDGDPRVARAAGQLMR